MHIYKQEVRRDRILWCLNVVHFQEKWAKASLQKRFDSFACDPLELFIWITQAGQTDHNSARFFYVMHSRLIGKPQLKSFEKSKLTREVVYQVSHRRHDCHGHLINYLRLAEYFIPTKMVLQLKSRSGLDLKTTHTHLKYRTGGNCIHTFRRTIN